AQVVIGVAETALLVPVAAVEPLVRKHRLALDPVAPLGVPAHITVLYPFIPPDAVDQSVCDAVTDVLAQFSAFDFALTAVRTFPSGVLYLEPQPADPFAAITTALTDRWPEHQPYGGSFASVIPHLTVAVADGASATALEAELDGGLPVRTRADAVWLMEGQPDDRRASPGAEDAASGVTRPGVNDPRRGWKIRQKFRLREP
ncbi:MAG: 2'-5' RNA ligase family protein, partial [Acidimicrobiia bacterium]